MEVRECLACHNTAVHVETRRCGRSTGVISAIDQQPLATDLEVLNHGFTQSFSPKQAEEWTNLRPVGAILAFHADFSTLIRSYLVSVRVDVATLLKTALPCRALSAEYSFVQ